MTLDIYVCTGRQGIYFLYSKGICELTYNEFTIQRNDKDELNTYNFPIWDTIQAEIKDEVKIDENEFYEVGITPKTYNSFCIYKSDIQKLNDFCEKRNQEMLYNKESVYNYINTDILNIAENLLNIAEENIMLNYRVVARCHINYSHIDSNIFMRNHTIANKYEFRYELSKETYHLKGKEKKDAEKFNDELRKKIVEFEKLIDNFVEIIIEEKNERLHRKSCCLGGYSKKSDRLLCSKMDRRI